MADADTAKAIADGMIAVMKEVGGGISGREISRSKALAAQAYADCIREVIQDRYTAIGTTFTVELPGGVGHI